MGRKKIWIVLAVVACVVLGLIWFDGGQQEQRLIEQPVVLSPSAGQINGSQENME
ncbi:hypothetical protein GRI39_05465 [Altererythrobacter indicus]|uniref:Uncharacterized protein n=1 Tax=Altericroceibacterium indicum TaxID=374177 RepID=A0A845A840_9SPHN|nr:hypothetical protein [Altericroceibacterium indicum]MXP25489.1 hypothetical protein [Altericroceibacterium indicum]